MRNGEGDHGDDGYKHWDLSHHLSSEGTSTNTEEYAA